MVEEMVARKRVNLTYIPPHYISMIKSIKQHGNPMMMLPDHRAKPPVKIPKKADTLFYAGCISSLRYKRHVEAAAKILGRIGYKFTMFGTNEVCCGYPLHAIGLDNDFRTLANTNIMMFQKAGIRRVIAACPACLRTLKHEYSELIGKVPFEVVHVTEVIVKAIEKDKLHFKSELKIKAVYHDPCHLGRYSGIYDPPRKIATSIPGLKYLEIPEWNREKAWCCGGLVGLAFRELATAMSKRIILDVKSLKSDSILTACPTCLYNLSIIAEDFNLQVYDLTELTAAAMGLVDLEGVRRHESGLS